MVYRASGHDPHAAARNPHPPAEVDLLHVGEERGVETAQLAEDLRTAAERRTAHPEHVALVVVLPLVALHAAQDAPAAERVAQQVEVSARGPRILERRPVAPRPQLRGHGRHVGFALQHLKQRFEPPRRGLHVGVQQHEALRIHLAQRTVVPLGEAVVASEAYHAHRGELAREHLGGVVRGAVVGHGDPHPCGRRGHHRGQEGAQVVAAVPVEYDDLCGHSRLCFHLRWDHIHNSGRSRIIDSRRRT